MRRRSRLLVGVALVLVVAYVSAFLALLQWVVPEGQRTPLMCYGFTWHNESRELLRLFFYPLCLACESGLSAQLDDMDKYEATLPNGLDLVAFLLRHSLVFRLMTIAATAVAIATTARALVQFLRWRRPPPGLCQHCGYALTGNVSGRCPECGTSIRPSAARETPWR